MIIKHQNYVRAHLQMEGIPLITLNEKGYVITLVLRNLSHILFLEVYFIYTYIIVMQQNQMINQIG
jgi:hypothetical protein